MKQRLLCGMLLLLVALSGCRGWDDDSEYAIGTRASFFLLPANGGYSLLRLTDSTTQENWNTDAGLASAQLSDVTMADNYLWLADGQGRRILQVDPGTGAHEKEYGGLPVRPHFIAVGLEQVIACDTLEGAIAFVKRRNGKTTRLEFEGKPGRSIYSNGRFYTQVNDSLVYVFDEKAFTPRAQLNIGASILEFQLDRYNNVSVRSRDTSRVYQAIIASNADYISRPNFAVNYQKSRLTPYFTRRYTTEYLNDLQLLDSVVQTPTAVEVLSGAENFEADFFGGTLFYTRGDSLFRYDLNQAPAGTPELVGVLSGIGQMRRSWHQLAEVN